MHKYYKKYSGPLCIVALLLIWSQRWVYRIINTNRCHWHQIVSEALESNGLHTILQCNPPLIFAALGFVEGWSTGWRVEYVCISLLMIFSIILVVSLNLYLCFIQLYISSWPCLLGRCIVWSLSSGKKPAPKPKMETPIPPVIPHSKKGERRRNKWIICLSCRLAVVTLPKVADLSYYGHKSKCSSWHCRI